MLYMTTAGMAATRPSAVASNASAMPGATTARFVVCASEMPMKEFMMPHTVPNRPTKGAVAPMVASTPVPRAICCDIAASTRSSRSAMRSFNPSSMMPRERLASRAADWMIWATASEAPWLACSTSPSVVSLSSIPSRRFASDAWRRSSMVLASHTVQVTSEAKARPIMTAFTTMSAPRNMPQGDRLRGNSALSAAASAAPGNSAAAPPIAPAIPRIFCRMIAPRPRRSLRRRRDAVGERLEARKLVGAQRPRLVTADEHLEHDAAVDIEEGDEGGLLAHEGPLDKSDAAAALVPQMAVQALRLHQVEIAAADLTGWDRASEFKDRIVGVNDQRHLAPLRDVPHGGRELAARAHTNHFRRQRKVTPRAVIEALPTEMVRVGAGSEFDHRAR